MVYVATFKCLLYNNFTEVQFSAQTFFPLRTFHENNCDDEDEFAFELKQKGPEILQSHFDPISLQF